MAQPIGNTLQNNTSLTGLMGLNPLTKPKVQTSTPALLPSQIQPNQQMVANTNAAKALFPTLNPAPAAPAPQSFGAYTGLVPHAPNQPSSDGYATAPVGTNTAAGNYNPNANYNAGVPQQQAPAGTPVVSNSDYPYANPGGGSMVNGLNSTQNLAGNAQSSAAPVRGLFPNVVSSLAGSGAANAALGANAQKIAADAGQQIADVGGQGARFEAGQRTTGTSPVAQGNAAVTAQTTAAEQSAIAQGASQALQGNQQAISAQGQTQSALTSAGNLAQPQVAAYGQTSFNPTTGEFAGGGSLPPEVMQQYAQMASSGQYSAIPSFITSNPVLNAQLNVAAKALNPNYTPVGAQGASSVLGGIPALTSANAAADGIKNTIQTYLQSNPTLNPSNLAAGNQLQQWIQGKQLTDPKYQTLFNYLDEYTNTLAPILGVGGDPTNLKTQIAQGFINGAASGQSISQVLDSISTLATHKISDIQSGALGNGTSVPATSGGASTGGFAETW